MKKLIIILSILGLLSASQAFAVTKFEISDGSVRALWHLNDTVDSSGNGYALTNSTNTVSFVAGTIDNASKSTSSLQFLFSAASSSAPVSQTYSQVILFNRTAGISVSGDRLTDLAGAYPNVNNNLVSVTGLSATTAKIEFYDGTLDLNGGINIPDATWHEVVVTKTGSAGTITMWVDGVLDKQGVAGTLAASTPTLLNGGDHKLGFNGLVDEVTLTNTVMTTSTVTSLWNSGSPLQICNTVGCAAVPPTLPTSDITYY